MNTEEKTKAKDEQFTLAAAALHGLRRIISESSDDEFREMLGTDFDVLAARGRAAVQQGLKRNREEDFLAECETDTFASPNVIGHLRSQRKKLVKLVRAYKKMAEAERHSNECLLRNDESAALRSTQECSSAYMELQQILEGIDNG